MKKAWFTTQMEYTPMEKIFPIDSISMILSLLNLYINPTL